jgi:C4-dicarboxylate-specific signal transduction histidine kinase
MHNALIVARTTGTLRRVDISIVCKGPTTIVEIADDGCGLPPHVAARLFLVPVADGPVHGHGLAIARELMERDGGTLACETSHNGTVFRLELATFTSTPAGRDSAVTRSFGRRARN